MSRDYYKILGVNSQATKKEIKKAYRDLSKKHHPDVGGNETIFKEINEAYSVLSDDQKRSEYDNPIFNIFDKFDFPFAESMFSNMYRRPRRSTDSINMRMRGKDLNYVIDISLYESICGLDREFEYEFEDICSKCRGVGGITTENCSKCQGVGFITITSQSGNMRVINQSPCDICKGRGYTAQDKCEECEGTGKIIRHEKIIIKTQSDLPDNSLARFTGAGHFGINGGPDGDLLIKFKIRMPKKEDLSEEQLEVLKSI